MPVVYTKGDVTEAVEDIIAHGVNCMGAMGAGVARALMMKWPEVRKRYMDNHELGGWELGSVQLVAVNDRQVVANCATQKTYLPRGVRHVDYSAVDKCMKTLYAYSVENNLSVAMPMIGAGLAGGDWTRIEEIINRIFVDKVVKVYVFSQ